MFTTLFNRISNAFRKKQRKSSVSIAVENFCKEFQSLPTYTDDNFRIAVGLLTSESGQQINIELSPGEKQLLDIIPVRIKKYLSIRMDLKAMQFLAMLAINPATVVMYLAYIQYWGYCYSERDIDLNLLTRDIFPAGLPDESSLRTIWYSQKVERKDGSDNMLDDKAAYASIQFPGWMKL